MTGLELSNPRSLDFKLKVLRTAPPYLHKKHFSYRNNFVCFFDIQGSAGHYGTYQSIIHGVASAREGNLEKLRSKLFPNPMPKFGPKLPRR